MGHTTQNMMKLSHTALFLAAAVVPLATGLPTSPKEVLESIGKADTIVPEGEAAAVEITQKAQTHNNHKDAAPKLGGLQMSRGGLNQPCKTDPSIGSFCDSVYISDTLASLEAKCVYGCMAPANVTFANVLSLLPSLLHCASLSTRAS